LLQGGSNALVAEALAQRGGGTLLSKLVSDCLSISPTHSEGWLAAALHWKQDLARMSELLEKVTASDAHCVHAHLLEAELHLERRQYAAALFSARNAHALHRSVRSYRSGARCRASLLRALTCGCSALVKTYLGQSRSKDALVVAKVSCCILSGAQSVHFHAFTPLTQQELMESQPRSARALVVMVRTLQLSQCQLVR
jgi:hypothetical protein